MTFYVINSFALVPTNLHEIMDIANDAKSTRSEGPDGIDPMVAKKSIGQIAMVVSDIINTSFDTGIVLLDLKLASVTPVFKQGDKLNTTNYRPISILPYFAKIMEKIMCARLNSYIDKLSLIYFGQFGFRAGHSTDMALIDIHNHTISAIDDKKLSILIFLDLAKALDTVNHKILIKNLNITGYVAPSLIWFTDYLTNRYQQVRCNGATSSSQAIICGVPQGPNLGPLLFILYINDLPNVCKFLKVILFTDDTNAFYSHESKVDLISIVNEELLHMKDWFCANRLSLNLEKTNFIVFHPPQKPHDVLNEIVIDGVTIKQVS